MLVALGAASSVLDALQSLTASSSSSGPTTGSNQTSAGPFDLTAGTAASGNSTALSGGGGSQISPQTMSALIAAQSQSGSSASASLDPSQSLQDLFSLIDANGDGQITQGEFENALGAGGTNLAQADSVFNQLDSNGDGTVSLNELKSALQGAGGHHGGHHHVHAGGSGQSGESGSADGTGSSSSDPLMQALAGASSNAVTNSDGSTTTTLSFPDGSKVTLTTPAASSGSNSTASNSATSSYNWMEQMIQREAQAISASASTNTQLSISA